MVTASQTLVLVDPEERRPAEIPARSASGCAPSRARTSRRRAAHSGALEAIERVLNRRRDADDVLREVVSILHARLGRFVRISFVEGDRLVPGPAEGEETDDDAVSDLVPGSAGGATSRPEGRSSAADRAVLERVAAIVSPYALVGWDTDGEEWDPLIEGQRARPEGCTPDGRRSYPRPLSPAPRCSRWPPKRPSPKSGTHGRREP